jgi:hypothetical protein
VIVIEPIVKGPEVGEVAKGQEGKVIRLAPVKDPPNESIDDHGEKPQSDI